MFCCTSHTAQIELILFLTPALDYFSCEITFTSDQLNTVKIWKLGWWTWSAMHYKPQCNKHKVTPLQWETYSSPSSQASRRGWCCPAPSGTPLWLWPPAHGTEPRSWPQTALPEPEQTRVRSICFQGKDWNWRHIKFKTKPWDIGTYQGPAQTSQTHLGEHKNLWY